VRVGRRPGDSGGPCESPESSKRTLSFSRWAIGAATTWTAAVTRTTTLSFALALPVALAAAPAICLDAASAFALTLTDTRAAVHTRAAVCLLACLLAGGALRVALRRGAVAISAAALATLRQRASGRQ